MEQNYLLTYTDKEKNYNTFAWFSDEETMNEFAEHDNIEVIEKHRIHNAEELV